MGAEEEREAPNRNPVNTDPKPNRITQAQFLSWKSQKVYHRKFTNARWYIKPFLELKQKVKLTTETYAAVTSFLANNFSSRSLEEIRLVLPLCWSCIVDAIASARKAEAERKRCENIAAGLVQMNGRELFQNEPWVFDNSRY